MPTPRRPLSIAIVSGKGGVGKTTTTISLAAALAERGLHVLAVDCDPQSNLTSGLGVDPYGLERSVVDVLADDASVDDALVSTEWGIDLLPAHPDLTTVEGRLRSGLNRELLLREVLTAAGAEQRWDAILIDTPPTFGFHTLNALGAARWVMVPLQMSGFALRGLKELLRVVHAARSGLNPELTLLGIAPTFVNERTRLSRELLDAVCGVAGLRVFDTRIRVTVRLQETALVGEPITVLAPRSPAAEAYRALAGEVLDAAGWHRDMELTGSAAQAQVAGLAAAG